MKTICEYINYIEGCEDLARLSAEVGVVEGQENFYLFDCGNGEQIANEIMELGKVKPVRAVISHFHPDHCGNADKCSLSELYIGRNTLGYVKAGTVVEAPLTINDGVLLEIYPLSSTHAKGCLAMRVGEYVFVGDALYTGTKKNERVFNVQFLAEQISFLEKLDVKFVIESHSYSNICEKSVVLARLKEIYERREKNNPYIKA